MERSQVIYVYAYEIYTLIQYNDVYNYLCFKLLTKRANKRLDYPNPNWTWETKFEFRFDRNTDRSNSNSTEIQKFYPNMI